MGKTGENGCCPSDFYPGGTAGAVLYQIDSGITGATATGEPDQVLSSLGTQRPFWKPVTGSGNVVLQISPTLITPNIGAATAASLNVTGSVNIASLSASKVVGTDASKNLTSLNNTGTGDVVLQNTPTLITPILGAASATSINVSSLTPSKPVGTDASKNLTSFATTGSGTTVVMQTSPALITPDIGTATGTQLTVNGVPGQPSEYNTLICKTITDNAGCGIQLLNASVGTPGAYNILLTQSAFEQNGLALSGTKNIFFGAGNASAANSVQIKRNTTSGGPCQLYLPGLAANSLLATDANNIVTTRAAFVPISFHVYGARFTDSPNTITGNVPLTGTVNGRNVADASFLKIKFQQAGGGGGDGNYAPASGQSGGGGGGSGAAFEVAIPKSDVTQISYSLGYPGRSTTSTGSREGTASTLTFYWSSATSTVVTFTAAQSGGWADDQVGPFPGYGGVGGTASNSGDTRLNTLGAFYTGNGGGAGHAFSSVCSAAGAGGASVFGGGGGAGFSRKYPGYINGQSGSDGAGGGGAVGGNTGVFATGGQGGVAFLFVEYS